MSLAEEMWLVVLAGLSTWQAVEIWHHGWIFRGPRTRLRSWRDSDGQPVREWIGMLATCPFCLAEWVAAGIVLLLVSQPAGSAARFAVYVLAASRLAQLANDATHTFCRTPAQTEPDAFHDGDVL